MTSGRSLITFVFLFVLSIGMVRAQETSTLVSLQFDNRPLAEVLREITRQTGMDFSYNPDDVDVTIKITVHFHNRGLPEVLDFVLTRNRIEWQRVENHLVLKPMPRQKEPPASVSQASPARHTLSGFLKDRATGEVLIGAHVYIKGSVTGVMTNGYGYFALTLPEGTYPVVFSYLGYQQIDTLVELHGPTRLSPELEPLRVDIREVEIIGTTEQDDLRDNQMSEFRFSGSTLARLPGFGGDLDVIRALQAVPGIQTFGDGSALYFVRGGNSDQNRLLIDEVPVYNPSHLFGFFSAFAPDAINSVQVYKGDFPARYGGQLSSVIDIKAREGNMRRFGISGNIGPYASNLTLEGPIVKDKASFLVSGRVSTLNWLNNLPYFNKSFDFIFYDVNAKLNFRLKERDRFYLTLYGGQDIFSRYLTAEVNSLGIQWNNLAGTLRWNHLFSSRLFLNTTVNYSRYAYLLNLPQEQDGYWNSVISNATLKGDMTWYLSPTNTVRTGLEVTYHQSNPGNVTLQDGTAPAGIPVVAKYHSMEYVWYASNDQKLGDRWTLRYGLRLPVWQDMGPTDVCYFDANHQVIDTIHYGGGEAYSTAFSPEPRLGIRYQVTENTSLQASYTRMTQFMQILSNSTGPFISLEVWAPSGPNIRPQVADQVALGFSKELARPALRLSAEGYYKWYQHHLDYRDHANLLYNTLIEGELRFGKAWSYGIELLARKTTGKLTGWIGYTWSRSWIQTPGVNSGNAYPACYDRPHDFTISLSWDDHRRWLFTASWIYLTGGAITTPTGFYNVNGYSVPVYGEKNNDRLPDYHRLDLSARYRFNKPGNRYQHSLAVTLYNAYGRLNPFSVNFNKMMNDNGDFVVPSDLGGGYSLVPTSISVAGIIPSINYIFRF